jgi:hypothetical protein
VFLQQRITGFVGPKYIQKRSSDMTLVWHPNRVVGGLYMISEGEIISVAGWSDLVNRQALLPIGDTSLLMLFYESLGFFIFVFHVPTM